MGSRQDLFVENCIVIIFLCKCVQIIIFSDRVRKSWKLKESIVMVPHPVCSIEDDSRLLLSRLT